MATTNNDPTTRLIDKRCGLCGTRYHHIPERAKKPTELGHYWVCDCGKGSMTVPVQRIREELADLNYSQKLYANSENSIAQLIQDPDYEEHA